MRTIDLNCDVGESSAGCPNAPDAAAMASITSANVACGLHAGDPTLMRRTVRLARDAGVAVGAHPGLSDRAGFGRVEARVSPEEVEDLVLYQIGALAAIAASEGVPLRHVKAHGALYNMAARDRALADALARGVRAFDPSLVLFGMAGSAMLSAGAAARLSVAAEGFADRTYEPDGSLTPRSRAGAILHDPDVVVPRAVRMVLDGAVVATDGSEMCLRIDTLCIHGDTPGSGELATAVRLGLERAGISVARFGG